MPAEHFTRTDLVGVALATLIFAAFLVPPGYVFGWMVDFCGFRKQVYAWQLVVSLPLSIGIAPILTFLLWAYAGAAFVWTFYTLALVFFLGFSIRAKHLRIGRWAVGAMLVWLMIVWLSGIDLQFGDRLYASVLSYDFNVRTAITDSIARNGLPAKSPFFYPGHAVPLRYHYFWLIFCALVDTAGGRFVDARQALIASDVWCGWALMAIIALYLRFFCPAGERGFESRAKWAIGSLAFVGLDVVPVLILDIVFVLTKFGGVAATVFWWNEQVAQWIDNVLWVAHHISSVVACFVGFLLLWRNSRESARRFYWPAVCAGLCFASAAGLSIYIFFTFSLFLAVFGIRILVWGTSHERRIWAASGSVLLLSVAPYLLSLMKAGDATGNAANASDHFATFAIRSFRPYQIVLQASGWSADKIAFANLVILPVNYFLETGVWFVLACIWVRQAWRRRRKLSKEESAALTMFAVSLFVGTFVRSTVISANDLGWRSLAIGELILIVWSVDPLRAWWRNHGRRKQAIEWGAPVALLIVLGLGTSLYDLVILRTYLPLVDHKIVPQAPWFPEDLGRLTYDAREVYARLGEIEPPTVVLQGNPTHWNDVLHGLYAMRQTASFDAGCGAAMGGVGDCTAMQAQLAPLFTDPKAAQSEDIDAVCDRWGINVLVAKEDDPIFADRQAWAWRRQPIASNRTVRAVDCGTRRDSIRPQAP